MLSPEDLDGAVPGSQVQFYSQEYNGTHIGHVVGSTEKTLLCKLQRGKKWLDVVVRKALVKAVYHATPPQEIAQWLEQEAERVRQEGVRAQREAEREARRQEALKRAAEIESRRQAREDERKAVEAARAQRKAARQKKIDDQDAVKAAKAAARSAKIAEAENKRTAREARRQARENWNRQVAAARGIPDCFV